VNPYGRIRAHISRMTSNVLKRFSDLAPFKMA